MSRENSSRMLQYASSCLPTWANVHRTTGATVSARDTARRRRHHPIKIWLRLGGGTYIAATYTTFAARVLSLCRY